MALWFPRWSVVAALAAIGETISDQAVTQSAVVVVRGNRVLDASQRARADGVLPGLRLREAQSRSPQARVLRADEAAESRAFAQVLDVLERAVAGVEAVRPGLCIVPARGPTRFYGGEVQAVAAVVDAVRAGSVAALAAGVRVGVADDVFAAEQAAYASLPSPVFVAQGRSRDFLDPLPIERLADGEVASLLQRLGVTTFGGFASLPAELVEARLGAVGAVLHDRVSGLDGRAVVPRQRHEDLALRVHWDEPIEREDQLAFAVRDAVGRLVDDLAQRRLVATAVRIELVSDRGDRSDRLWSHPQCFDASGIVDRLRWQVQASASRGGNGGDFSTTTSPGVNTMAAASRQSGLGTGPAGGYPPALDGGITQVTITPERVAEAYRFERALFGSGVEDRVAQGLARVQGIVGHDGVLVAQVTGGRSVRDRRVFVPWGEQAAPVRGDGPWPGRLPSPSPSLVYADRVAATVWDAAGGVVSVDSRGTVSAHLASFEVVPVGARPRRHQVVGWAGPWAVAGRWWDSAISGDAAPARVDRFQCVDDEGIGWLLALEAGRWWVEARYD